MFQTRRMRSMWRQLMSGWTFGKLDDYALTQDALSQNDQNGYPRVISNPLEPPENCLSGFIVVVFLLLTTFFLFLGREVVVTSSSSSSWPDSWVFRSSSLSLRSSSRSSNVSYLSSGLLESCWYLPPIWIFFTFFFLLIGSSSRFLGSSSLSWWS